MVGFCIAMFDYQRVIFLIQLTNLMGVQGTRHGGWLLLLQALQQRLGRRAPGVLHVVRQPPGQSTAVFFGGKDGEIAWTYHENQHGN